MSIIPEPPQPDPALTSPDLALYRALMRPAVAAEARLAAAVREG